MRLAKRWLRFFSLKSRDDRRRRWRRDEFARRMCFEPLESRRVLSVSLGLSNSSFIENGGTTTLTATLSAALGSDVTVPLLFTGTATENTNFSASAESITIPAGSLSNFVTLTGIDTSTTTDQSLTASEGTVTGDTAGSPSSVTATITGDPTVNLSLANPTLAENGGSDTLTATLSAASASDVTVDLDFSTGTAQENVNFSSSADSILIPAGQTTGFVTLTGIDTSNFTNQSVIGTISGVTSGIVKGANSTATASLVGDPTVNLSDSAGGTFAENGGSDTVTATLSSPATGPVSIALNFAGSADSSSYMASGTVINIAKGATSGTITLTGVDQGDSGGDILVSVDTQNTTGAAPGTTPSVDIPLIGDPTFTLSDNVNGKIAQNGGSGTVTATLSAPAPGPVSIVLDFGGSATSGTNYSTSASVINIAKGQTSGTITINGLDSDDGDENVLVSVDNSSTGIVFGNGASDDITLTGDPTVTLSDNVSGKIAQNGGSGTVTATLSEPAPGPVSIVLDFGGSATSGTNYSTSASVITIAKGETSGTITIAGKDTNDGDEDVLVSIDSASTGIIVGAASDDITLVGDPTVNLSDSTGGSFAENGGTDVVTATLSSPATGPVTIHLSFGGTASQNTNYSTSGSVITIAKGDTTGSITLTGKDTNNPNNQDVEVSINSTTGAIVGSDSSVDLTINADPLVTLSDSGSGSFAEAGGTDVITASLAGPAPTDIVVNLNFSGTAHEGTNFSASGNSITILAGQTSNNITLTGTDTSITSNQDLTVSIASAMGAVTGGTSSLALTEVGDPTVSLSIDNSSFDENGGSATVTATLSATSLVPVTVNLGFSSTGTDFTPSANSITIQPGNLTGTITLSGQDKNDSNDETVTTTISSGSGVVIGSPSSVTATVVADPIVTLSLGSGSFAENGGTDTVIASLSAPATGIVTITLNFSGTVTLGTNFTTSSTTITISPGATSNFVTLTGIDKQDTTDETITVGIATSQGAAVGNPASLNATLTGDPFATLSIGTPTFNENGGTDTITATLSKASTEPVTINLGFSGAANQGVNYSASSQTITIPAGSTSNSIILTGLDTHTAANQGLTVSIASGTVGAAAGNPSSVSATLTGEPTATLSISKSSFAEAGGTDTVTVTLSQASTSPLTINLGFTGSANLGSNYTTSNSTLTIPAGSTSGTFTLTGVDTHLTTNQNVTVSLASGSGYAIGSPSSASATLAGDLTVSLTQSANSFAQNGGTDTITATLSAAATSTVTVNLNFGGTATQGKNYSTSNTVITINAGQTSGSITLTGLDTSSSSNLDAAVSISSATGATVISPSTVDPTLTGDPTVNLSLSASTFNENGGTDTVTATLSSATTVPITVTLTFGGTATNGTAYTPSGTTITIPAGSTMGTITLTAIDQKLTTGSPTVTVGILSLSAGAVQGTTNSVTATIQNNDTLTAPTGQTLSSSSAVAGLTNYVTTDTPSFTITAPTGETVQILVNGTAVGTATESTTTPGTYTVSIPAGKLQLGNNSITSTASNSNGTSSPSTATTLIYAPAFTQVYTVPGAIGTSISVTFKYTSRNAAFNDEVGFFVVSNSTGTVNGIAPGASGYAQAALSSGTVLFSGASSSPGATKTVTLAGGELIAYYLVQNNSTANFLSSNPSDSLHGIVTFFSIDAANPDPVRHADITGNPTTGNIQVGWEDMTGGGDKDYNDMVISVVPSTTSGQTGAALVVPGSSTDQVTLTFKLQNLSGTLAGDVGIFTATDSSGTVGGIAPGASGFASGALASSNSQVLFAAGSAAGATKTITLAGGTQFGFYTINSGTTAQFLAGNASDSSSGSPVALFSFDSANPDSENHFRWFDPEEVSDISPTLNSLSDPQLLHVMDKVFGSASDFDSFDVGVQL